MTDSKEENTDVKEKSEEPEKAESEAVDDEEEDLFGGDDDDDDDAKAPAPALSTPSATTDSLAAPASSEAASAVPLKPKEVAVTGEDSTPAPPASNGPPAVPLATSSPIPRISHSSTTSLSPSKAPAASLSGGTSGAKYGLPADVLIPVTVTPGLLQGRLLETLRTLPKQLITDALAEYDDAVQIKGESIRNHGAYLFGVIKRYVNVQERASSGEGTGILPMGPELTVAVNQRLQKLVQDGFCTQDEMNEKVKSKIRMLSEKDAMFAIEELSSVDRTQIRNFGSYFMGILNRYMRGERKDVTSGRKTLAEVRQGFQQNSGGHRFDDRRNDRGRDNDPQYRRSRDHNDSSRRDRSRDRYDGDGRQNSNYDQYNRNAGPYGPSGMSGMPGNPPPPPPRPPTGMPGSNPYQPQPSNYGPSGQQPPSYGQQPQQQYPPPSSPYGNHQHQGPPRMGGQQQMPQQPYGQHSFVQQSPYGPAGPGNHPPPNSYGAPPNQQPPGYMGQQQSYSNNPPYQGQPPGPNSFGTGASHNQWSPAGGLPPLGHQPNTQGSAVDILALADKASSAVQALQNQNKYQGPPMGGAPPMQHQPPPPSNPYQQPPNNYSQPPQQMSAPPPYPPMNQPYHQPPHQQQQHQYHQDNQANQGGKPRRRTTANMNELPITVQYAVQNLQATGQINGPLDDGMLGMVKDLPEDLALQALQKFSAIDKNTMRNKTAYLAGVLRRELEKINRR